MAIAENFSVAVTRQGISRRRFVFSTSAAAGFVWLFPWQMRAMQKSIAPGDVHEAYRKGVVIDALAYIYLDDSGFAIPLQQGVLDDIARSGVTAINYTAGGSGDFEETVREIAFLEGIVEAHPTRFLIVRRFDDLSRAKREDKLGLIIGFQGTNMIGDNLKRIELFQRLGVRIIQMTYNRRNFFGDGALEPANAGLSTLGREAIEQLNSLRVAIDVSHCGMQTTADAIAASSQPVIVSHSACNEVFRHPRNKDDRELRALAERGGVIGIYFMPFLHGGPGPATEEILLKHIEHALKVCGTDHVGIGSDQSLNQIPDGPEYRKSLKEDIERRVKLGISAPGESIDRPPFMPVLNHSRRLEQVALKLAERGHPTRVIEQVIGKNFERVFREIWGTP